MENGERLYNPVYKCRICGNKRPAAGIRVYFKDIAPNEEIYDSAGRCVFKTALCLCGDDAGIGFADLIGFAPEHQDQLKVETNLYDQEEIHENCTVQIWRNSATGEMSIGWWENEDGD